MNMEAEKIQELIRASHIIAYEGYYDAQDKNDGEISALFRTIIHLLSKAITRQKKELGE